jgi:hypothetical protein
VPPVADLDHPVAHPYVVHGDGDGRVVEAAAGAEVERVTVPRGRHERHVPAATDDPPGEPARVLERVVVAHGVHLVVGGSEQRDSLAVDQCGRPPFDLEILDPAHRQEPCLVLGGVRGHPADARRETFRATPNGVSGM